MKELVWFLIVFICMEFVFSKPQNLQDQLRLHLDPLNQPESEYLHKDQGKRTIFPAKHYLYGKHVAIDSHGHKFLLGYTPLNVKYQSSIRPIGILKPTFHQNNIVPWRPFRQYLPSAAPVPSPLPISDNEWKPILSPSLLPVPKPGLDQLKPWDGGINSAIFQHAHPINPNQHAHPFHSVQPLQPVQTIHFPGINHIQPVNPIHHFQPGHPIMPTVPIIPPAVKPILPDAHVRPLLHNYYYYQTPVSKPVILPQQQLFHVGRPQLPVLPLGAAFPAAVAQHQNVPVVHSPEPVVLQSQPEIPFVHNHQHNPISFFTPSHQLPPQHSVPIPDVSPIVHSHLPEQPQTQPLLPSLSVPVSFPPLTVEFHGNHHLNPFNLHTQPINNTLLFTSINSPPILYGRQPHQEHFPESNNEYLPPITHFNPVNNHPENRPSVQPQFLFNPAVRPGHNDLHIPEHLPNHPQFTYINDHNLLPPYPNNLIKPSISLEPPFTASET
ncbi:hypothetical protein RN001_002593 [Aquatica leii]|uniref:Uncharacterized protein n=1 Tax=Aquatica leii TaxID=1421715 RepID=A0AAN7SK90_9COLE|nr:hypothetical protein RN001_002593 [Aquatica leii]